MLKESTFVKINILQKMRLLVKLNVLLELFHHLRMVYISRKAEKESGTEMVERQPH